MKDLKNDNLSLLLKIAEEAVISGGKHIKQEYFKETRIFLVTEKSKNDYVTDIDIESEQIIRNTIKKYIPSARIIGEEEGEEGDSDIEWYVDPLDGTGAFIKGNVAFVSVSVSAIEKSTETILVGAVYNPFTEVLYLASKTGLVKPKFGDQKIVSLNKARILLDISEDHPLHIRKKLPFDNEDIGRILRFDGSFAQHMCFLASGTLDGGIFWGTGEKGTFLDLASAYLICKQAGLKVTDLSGKELTFNRKFYDQLVVAREPLHSELLRWVKNTSTQLGIKIETPNILSKKPKKGKKSTKSSKKS